MSRFRGRDPRSSEIVPGRRSTATPASLPRSTFPFVPGHAWCAGNGGSVRKGRSSGSLDAVGQLVQPRAEHDGDRGVSVTAERITAAAAWRGYADPGGASAGSWGIIRGFPRCRLKDNSPGYRRAAPSQAEPRQVVPALGGQRTDSAQLDADRADIGKPAKSEAGDHDRAIDQDVRL